ncbi:MAG: hypothetical protein HGB36_04620 [Chlorobiaceae bacterium]|nr:hypothetical protein [Chlorobiaceae bacterium]
MAFLLFPWFYLPAFPADNYSAPVPRVRKPGFIGGPTMGLIPSATDIPLLRS